jgi:hypothetical protein
LIERSVDVAAEGVSLDHRQASPALEEPRGCDTPRTQGSELGDRAAVTGHRYALTRFNPVDNVSAMVAQLANRHRIHGVNVSRVILTSRAIRIDTVLRPAVAAIAEW